MHVRWLLPIVGVVFLLVTNIDAEAFKTSSDDFLLRKSALFSRGSSLPKVPEWLAIMETGLKTLHGTTQKQSEKWFRASAKAFVSKRKKLVKPGYFLEKLTLEPGTEIALFGDIHGSAIGLRNGLTDYFSNGDIDVNWKVTKENLHFVFMGDYIDRGAHPTEVLGALYAFASVNPDKVHLIRGNHESNSVNSMYTESNEFVIDVGNLDNQNQYMPIALLVSMSGKWYQFCHGGIEVGYDVTDFKEFLESDVSTARVTNADISLSNVRKNCATMFSGDQKKATSCADVWENTYFGSSATEDFSGFQWADFTDHSMIGRASSGRGPAWGKSVVMKYLEVVGIEKLFHAHQHSGFAIPYLAKSKGLFTSWGGKVTQVLSATNVFPNETNMLTDGTNNYARITTNASPDKWRISQCHPKYSNISPHTDDSDDSQSSKAGTDGFSVGKLFSWLRRPPEPTEIDIASGNGQFVPNHKQSCTPAKRFESFIPQTETGALD